VTLDDFIKHMQQKISEFDAYYRDGLINGFEGNKEHKFEDNLNLAEWDEQFISWYELNGE